MADNNAVWTKAHYPEVLAPVGDFERLTFAVNYGADAVYLGGTAFGMRAASANFDFDTMKKAVEYAHARDVKVYLTCNTLPLNSEVEQLPDYLRAAQAAGVDAVIVADIGVLMEAKRVIPEVDVHISTQTGIVNYLTATELYKMGAKRVVLARELRWRRSGASATRPRPSWRSRPLCTGRCACPFPGGACCPTT